MRLLKASLSALLALALITSLASAATSNRRRDQALANRLTLHLSDLPAGWRTEGNSSSNKTCSSIKSVKSIETARAQTQFSNTPNFLGSVVGVLPTLRIATSTYGNIAAKAQACLRQLPGLTGGSIGRMSFPHVGDQSTAYNVQGTIQGVGVYADIVLVRVRRALALYEFAGVASGDTSLEIRLVRKAVSRA